MAFRALTIEKKVFLTCSCSHPRRGKLNKLSAFHTVSYVSCLVLFCSLSRSFFRLSHLRKVRKRCTHSIFSSLAIILAFFDQNPRLCYVCVFRFLWATVAFCLESTRRSGVTNKILTNSDFVRFR